MKLICRIILCVFFSLSATLALADMCPGSQFDFKHIPAGWTVNYINSLSVATSYHFYYAFYNSDARSKSSYNGGHVSCVYYDNNINSFNFVELISNQGGYPVPDSKTYPLWSTEGSGATATGWCNVIGGPVTPEQCSFGTAHP